MIDALRGYPEYKDSGVPWVGAIPAGWRVERAKWHFKRMARAVALGAETVTCYRDGTVTLRRNRRATGYTEAVKEIGYQGVQRGDLVIHAMDAFAGAVGVSDADGKCSPVYSICESTGSIDSAFAAILVREMARTEWILALAKGIRERSTDFRFGDFGEQQVPIPPIDEQRAIVRFLDYADRRIRKYIAAKRKLIALLEEQKRAIIDRAVTRGLDPNVRLKDSGVPWIGMVPEHWRVESFTRLAVERADYRGATPRKTEAGTFLVTARNVRRGYIDYECSREYIAPSDYAEVMRRGLPELEDLLLTTEAPLGHAALVDRTDVAFAQRVIRFRFDRYRVAPRFALAALLSMPVQQQFMMLGTGSTALGIKASKLPMVRVALPPVAEQKQILAVIQPIVVQLEDARTAVLREVTLLQEYRTRLVSDVVTGKFDVREAAARLADESPEELGVEVPLDDEDTDDGDALDNNESAA